MKRRFMLLATLAAAVTVALTVAPASPAAPTSPSVTLGGTVTGTCSFVDATTGQTVNGTIVNGLFTVIGFSGSGRTLFVTGTLTGVCTATNSLGQTVTRAISETVTRAVVGGTGSCRILHLEIGPIHLDLLGLVVDTNRIVIDVTAQSGPGNLLGNLLCGIAHLLDAGAPAQQVANLLNRLLAILN